MASVLLPSRRSRAVVRRQASCQVTAFRFWPPSVGVKNWTLGDASPELFLRRLPLLPPPFRMELLRRMELRFRSEFWCDSSLFWRVWIKMDGFSSSSLALQRGVATFSYNNVHQSINIFYVTRFSLTFSLFPSFSIISVKLAMLNSHLYCVAKFGVVNWVDALLLRYYGNKPVTPLDLLSYVGGPSLCGDPCCLHNSLQDDNHLQVTALQLHGWQVIQRAEGTKNRRTSRASQRSLKW